MSEFDLIRRYFTRDTPSASLGVGDDAALLQVSDGMQLVVSTDMLVSDTHFFADAEPFGLGHKALAVNLSDLAAMGARPRWATLALSLPVVDAPWLERFSTGFFELAVRHGVELVGGDTTRGPLNISVTIMGEVPTDTALCRHAARIGDDIWVSGTLGEAALALAHLQGHIRLPETSLSVCAAHLHRPVPRVELGLALRGLAHSAIDISDGLLADLRHLLQRSQVAAVLDEEAVLAAGIQPAELCDRPLLQRCIWSGGDDYELCFTAAKQQRSAITALSASLGIPLTRIGDIRAGQGYTVMSSDGRTVQIESTGYDHFA